jgi:hypothetical protein
MKNNQIFLSKTLKNMFRTVLCIVPIFFTTTCSEEFLKPDPLSFFEPENTFTTLEGLQSALASCDRNLRYIWGGDPPTMYTDLTFSEVAVNGLTDQTGCAKDINIKLTPTSNNNGIVTNMCYWFWDQGYLGIKYANTIISNIDKVKGPAQAALDDAKGQAYFHRAFRYLFLCFQFGDVPLITKAFAAPQFNLRTTNMRVILEKMTVDMEFAATHVHETNKGGAINRAACKHLLAKLYLATGRFDDAIRVTSEVIDNPAYALMTEPFGTFVNPMPAIHPVTRNVIWDLHRPENKNIAANKEVLYSMINRENFADSRLDVQSMRHGAPAFLLSNQIFTPDGLPGMSDGVTLTRNKIDLRKTYGRGIGTTRPTWYSTNTIWDDPNDLRHSHVHGNWMRMEDLVYNNPALEGVSEWYGKPLQKYSDAGALLMNDSVRHWFEWPHYKLWVESPRAENASTYNGGAADWYVYRLAETYLLRAEAYVWKGNADLAMADINAVRTRAKCAAYTDAGKINIGTVLDERARELYWEELRKVELTRIAYIFALTGKQAENGKTYTLAQFSQDSYWYDRISQHNNFYNKILLFNGDKYTISPFHIFWPIPQYTIDANREARINQNFGYDGYELNIPPIDNLEEAEQALK